MTPTTPATPSTTPATPSTTPAAPPPPKPAHRPVIVVGVDESRHATAALGWAATLAQRLGMRLRLVTAWQYPATAPLPGGPQLAPPEEMDQRARATVEATVRTLATTSDLPMEHLVEQLIVARGPAAPAIAAHLDPTTHLVVLGRRGLGTVEGVLLGSVSRRITETSPVPVALVDHPGPPLNGPIVVGVDDSTEAAIARDWAMRTATALGVPLVIVHGATAPPAEMSPSAIDHIEARAHRLVDAHAAAAIAAARTVDPTIDLPAIDTEVDLLDPRTLIGRTASDRAASMVVVGRRGEGAAAGLLSGSVVHHLAQSAELPVVIVTSRTSRTSRTDRSQTSGIPSPRHH